MIPLPPTMEIPMPMLDTSNIKSILKQPLWVNTNIIKAHIRKADIRKANIRKADGRKADSRKVNIAYATIWRPPLAY